VSVLDRMIEHMFDTSWIADLDADSACLAVAGNQQDLREQELRELLLAAHWATLHGADSLPTRSGPVLRGPSAPGGSAATAPRRSPSSPAPSWFC
jgi:hypothetical protein